MDTLGSKRSNRCRSSPAHSNSVKILETAATRCNHLQSPVVTFPSGISSRITTSNADKTPVIPPKGRQPETYKLIKSTVLSSAWLEADDQLKWWDFLDGLPKNVRFKSDLLDGFPMKHNFSSRFSASFQSGDYNGALQDTFQKRKSGCEQNPASNANCAMMQIHVAVQRTVRALNSGDVLGPSPNTKQQENKNQRALSISVMDQVRYSSKKERIRLRAPLLKIRTKTSG